MRARRAPGLVEQALCARAVGIALQAGERRGQRALATSAVGNRPKRLEAHSVLSAPPKAACAAASRAIGTR